MQKLIREWLSAKYWIMLSRNECHTTNFKPTSHAEEIAIGKHLRKAKRLEREFKKQLGYIPIYKGDYPTKELESEYLEEIQRGGS